MMEGVGRNQPCPCGSGKKYKHCCGSLGAENKQAPITSAASPSPGFSVGETKERAVGLHRQGYLQQAKSLYEQILQASPKDFDALHNLAILHSQLGNHAKALLLFLDVIDLPEVEDQALMDNMGRAILAAAGQPAPVEISLCPDLASEDTVSPIYAADLPELPDDHPLVSIVIPSYNHESFVAEAIRSVFAQTYPNIELIVIDDGSSDRSVEKIREVLGEAKCPARLVARENRGAHSSLNEAIELATGKFIGILNSDDRFSPDRILGMARLLHAAGKKWGFARTKFINGRGVPVMQGEDGYADELMKGVEGLYSGRSVTVGFGTLNYSISTGNLFFEKELWLRLGGFSAYRYVHDWDFCLRALEFESPAVLCEESYEYRLHGSNTVNETLERINAEVFGMLFAWAGKCVASPPGEGLRQKLVMCSAYMASLHSGHGHLLGTELLKALARRILSRDDSSAG